MSDIFRKITRRFKKDKGDPTAAHSSGQSTANPRSRSQASLHPHVSHQPTPDPLSGVQSTPDLYSTDRSITDRYAGGQYTPRPSYQGDHPTAGGSNAQSTPGPHYSGQTVEDGVYTITNVRHGRFVYLENPNDATPLRGHHRPGIRNAQWHVRSCGNGEYSIENVDHNRYAYCGALAAVEASVEGYSTEQLWRIQARPDGKYTIATTDTRNLWMLPYGDPGTPIELFNIPTDRRCWWTFQRQEIGDPVNEHITTQPALFEPKPLLIPSSGQRTPDQHSSSKHTLNPYPSSNHVHEGSINFLDDTSVIIKATNLLHRLRVARGALRVVTQRAEGIGHVDEDRKTLINVLKIHLATVGNHITKLKEDQKIDETIPNLNQEIGELLETYARELKEIYELLFDNQSNHDFTRGRRNEAIIVDKTRAIDETFRRYITALHHFAASNVDQMRQQLAQFGQEAVKARNTTEGARPTRIKRPNTYGVQHGECLQGTREKTLSAIRSWVDDGGTEKQIFFFLYVAGSGKSTVAKNMAEEWKQEKRLLARFFFSRDTTETMSTDSFCSTVAGAFARLDPDFKSHIDKFREGPNVELLPFEEQFEGLVAGPLRAIGRHAILVIDALDECDTELRDELLGILHAQHGSIPQLRILATGRPERDIKHWAEKTFEFGYANFAQLEGSDKDVELYINHRLQDLPIAQDRLYPVIRRAEGLFIWARVTCDLLVDSDDIDSLLEELGKEVSLDYLYRVALEQSIPKEGPSRRAMVLVLQMILAANEPLSIAELEMLSPKRGVVEKVVTRLGSVLLYQDREDPIRLLHATFREFLTARSKAHMFFIQSELGHHTLASGCLNVIAHVSNQDDSALHKLDRISDRKTISFLARYLLTVFPGLSSTLQTHGSIIVQWRTENLL